VRDRLTAALSPFRNRDAAFALATFLARFWTAPRRLGLAFTIDRRALADHGELELTEKRIRTAITTLEAVGFLERAIPPAGSAYKATPDGLHRKPIKFVFGPEYAPAFHQANKRARAARGADRRERRAPAQSPAPRPSTVILEAQTARGPKNRVPAGPQVNLGPVRQQCGPPAESSQNSALERALQRLGEGVFGKAEGG
jgi:hypothetical protein